MRRLPNGQRGHLIDALTYAIDFLRSDLDSNLPPLRADWTEDDKNLHAEETMQIREYRKLRKRLLADERAA